MFSTPLICCSSGVATVRDTVSADAPGYTVVICTVGGTISGYCATGRIASAPSPRSVTKALNTVAKRGRSIKKCVRRSEGHTSELQSQSNLVCRLLLEKKKKKINNHTNALSVHVKYDIATRLMTGSQ